MYSAAEEFRNDRTLKTPQFCGNRGSTEQTSAISCGNDITFPLKPNEPPLSRYADMQTQFLAISASSTLFKG